MRRTVCRAVVAAGLTLAASPAFALETAQCLPAAQARAILAAESQSPIIVGNRTGYGFPTTLIFTSNADGSKGYLIRGDKPFGETSETVCIDSVYRDIRLNDISKPGIPAWARMSGDARRAEDICKRDRLGYQEKCSAHDPSLAILESNGQHVMLLAKGTAINPRDKSVRPDQLILLTMDGTDGGGLLNATTREGASYILSAYTKAAYTQHGKAMLGKR